MSYLAFMFATGAFLMLGPGGPLHNDHWFDTLRRRVDATEPEFWLGFTLLVVLPPLALGLGYGFLTSVIGGAAMLLVGTAALFFGFGRADYEALADRFIGRCRAGDLEGGAMVLEEAGAPVEAEDTDAFGRVAGRIFVYEGFQRWFPAVFYFFLLGPFWAMAYRLIQLSADDLQVPVGSVRHLVDWLPSRLLLLTFALVGNFNRVWPLLVDQAMDPEIETDELLLKGVELSQELSESGPETTVMGVRETLQRSLLVWVVVISVVVILA